ncbi:hypothetical protein QQ045_012185 [Rhodiola kirilowii]
MVFTVCAKDKDGTTTYGEVGKFEESVTAYRESDKYYVLKRSNRQLTTSYYHYRGREVVSRTRQIVNIIGNKVRAKIREEVGESKFCILVDEALDVANTEKLAIILCFVDYEISRILAQYDINEENMRGQGYDGASNMSGQFNGLQTLFLKDCPYAYYVHCFAHCLQLTLNYVAKEVPDVWQFFSTLTMIVNFVDSFGKRHSMLSSYRKEEIQDLLVVGTLEIGSGMNQTSTLQRPGATRWGSYLRSISSLIKLFGATMATIDDLYNNGVDKQITIEAKGIDLQLMELEKRFPETSMELLGLIASFDPHNGFQAFKPEDVCKLASKFYPSNFTSCDMDILKMECGFFPGGIEYDSSGERAFSSMKIIKNNLRNTMTDEFLDDLMVVYIGRTFIDCISNDDVIVEFEMSGPRRVKFS